MTALSVHVLSAGPDGDALADRLADAGFTVSGPDAAPSTAAELAQAITHAPGADVVCVVGEYGPWSELAVVLDAVFGSRRPGYGEAYRRALAATAPGEAVLARVEAGAVGKRLVFAVPSDAEGMECALAVLVPTLRSLPSPDDAPVPQTAAIPFGGARSSSMGLSVSENREPEPAAKKGAEPEPGEAAPEPGWMRAVAALKAEVLVGRREDLPESIEKLAPVVNVLHTAGETGMMKLPSGRRYSLWGWPDLRRGNAKVLAVSWGEPLAEVVALHRHPHEAGTCIEEGNGLLPGAGTDIAEICTKITGRAPPNPEGTLFAISADAVWILRSRRVFKWDGSREKDDGNPKQVLASLALHWSNR
ncbi:MAG: hypothetical protein H6737_03765 [Alphaproteobacteria bacterium]|nr:hypothetical protein [Alphaproteobacteria bacterium]